MGPRVGVAIVSVQVACTTITSETTPHRYLLKLQRESRKSASTASMKCNELEEIWKIQGKGLHCGNGVNPVCLSAER